MQADARDSLVDLTVSLLTLRTVRHRRHLQSDLSIVTSSQS